MVCEEESLFTLRRCESNPLITARPQNHWEERSTFNPGGVLEGDIFHLFYRATDVSGISSIGYATITRQMKVDRRLDRPILTPDHEWEELGCEDPRVTRINNTVYMLYTAYSRRGSRIALALSSDLDKFTKIGLVGPDLNDKNAALFPERIRGKLAMIHRIEPSVQIAYFDNPEFHRMADPSLRSQYWTEYLHNLDEHSVIKPEREWEERKIGVGPPPIKTSNGWLIIYHGVDNNHVYRAGAALLDLDDPSKIMARSRTPILEPKEPYEKHGFVRNVVFPESAMVLDGVLHVFYGGADTVCCAATTPLDELLEWLARQH